MGTLQQQPKSLALVTDVWSIRGAEVRTIVEADNATPVRSSIAGLMRHPVDDRAPRWRALVASNCKPVGGP